MATKFKISQQGYILRDTDKFDAIERISYGDYLREFGGDETTTPKGIRPRLYADGNYIYSFGVAGIRIVETFNNKKEATNKLYEIWESNLEGAPYFAKTLNELYTYFADSFNKDSKVIKRYFRMQDYLNEQTKKAKIKQDNRPITTKEMMVEFIKNNREVIKTKLNELNELKQSENKAEWQVKANALVQKVSKNDFRVLNWKEVYNIIKKTV